MSVWASGTSLEARRACGRAILKRAKVCLPNELTSNIRRLIIAKDDNLNLGENRIHIKLCRESYSWKLFFFTNKKIRYHERPSSDHISLYLLVRFLYLFLHSFTYVNVWRYVSPPRHKSNVSSLTKTIQKENSRPRKRNKVFSMYLIKNKRSQGNSKQRVIGITQPATIILISSESPDFTHSFRSGIRMLHQVSFHS